MIMKKQCDHGRGVTLSDERTENYYLNLLLPLVLQSFILSFSSFWAVRPATLLFRSHSHFSVVSAAAGGSCCLVRKHSWQLRGEYCGAFSSYPQDLVESKTRAKGKWILDLHSPLTWNTTLNEWWCCFEIAGWVNKQLFVDKFTRWT